MSYQRIFPVGNHKTSTVSQSKKTCREPCTVSDSDTETDEESPNDVTQQAMVGVKTIDRRSTGLRKINSPHVSDGEDIMTEQPNHNRILSENDQLHTQDNEVEKEYYLNSISTNEAVDSEWELSEVRSSSQSETLQTNSIYSNNGEVLHQNQELGFHPCSLPRFLRNREKNFTRKHLECKVEVTTNSKMP